MAGRFNLARAFLKKDLNTAGLENIVKEALISPVNYDAVFSKRAVSIDREAPQLIADAIVGSALSLVMETVFQINAEQSLFRIQSKYQKVKSVLDDFHDQIDIDSYVLMIAYNLLVYGNLPLPLHYNSDMTLQRISIEPDYTSITPIVVSNTTLGFMKDGKFLEPFDCVYAQLMYYKDLGGSRSRSTLMSLG